MKVGTISVNINTPDYNYGAMLHSWAFQQYLLKYVDIVDEVEVIDYLTPILENYNRYLPLSYYYKRGKVKGIIKLFIRYPYYLIRLSKFKKFVKDNIVTSSKQYNQMQLNNATLDYDVIVCESDVIWSSALTGGVYDKSFFAALDSMQKMKRIAYSPSMGDAILSKQDEIAFKKYIKFLQFISCRETYEKEIIEKYTAKSVTHVLDPVMLLEASDYQDIIHKRLTPRNYILLYLPVNDNPYLRKAAIEYARKYNLEIIEISTKLIHSKEKTIKTLVTAGIEEFLSGIKYADMVFTNSFHAICFSILFEVQFYAFSRKYSGKVIDICKVFNLCDRYVSGDEFHELPNIDYTKVKETLIKKRNESSNWLIEALNNEIGDN